MRSKGGRVGWSNSAAGLDYSAAKAWDSELAYYRKAKSEGIQPASTKREAIDRAFAISDHYGSAYRAD